MLECTNCVRNVLPVTFFDIFNKPINIIYFSAVAVSGLSSFSTHCAKIVKGVHIITASKSGSTAEFYLLRMSLTNKSGTNINLLGYIYFGQDFKWPCSVP